MAGKWLGLGWVVLILLFRPGILKGAEWSFTPLVSLEMLYSDNYQLVPFPHDSAWGAVLTPEFSLAAEIERLNVNGKGHWSFYHFFENSGLDNDEHDLNLSLGWKITELAALTFSELHQVDSTLESELAATGAFLIWTERYQNAMSLGYEAKISEHLSLNSRYAYTIVAYAGNSLGLNDYLTHTFSATLEERWNERTTVFVSPYFSYYQISGVGMIARDIGMSIGGDEKFSETIKGKLSAGVHATETSSSLFGLILENRAAGLNLDFRIEKSFEPGHGSLELSREIQLSGTGTIVQVDRLTVGYDRELSERVSILLNGTFSLSQPFANSLYFPKYRYDRYEGKIIWQAWEEVDLSCDYSYANVATEGVEASPYANNIDLMMTWHPFKKSFSR